MTGQRAIITAASIIMLGNVASRLLGVVREQVIAGFFGASATTSAFVAASTIPTMVYDLLIGGAISAALIPVFSDYADKEREEELGHIASVVLSFVALAMVAAIAILELLAPQLVWLLGAGFQSEETRLEAITLARIVLPGVVLLGLSGVTTALLYSQQMFTYPAFCVAMYNFGIIVAVLLFHGRLDSASLAAGVLLGAFLQMAVQLPGLRRVRLSFSLDWRHPGVQRLLRLYGPVALGLVVSQVGVVIDRNLASRTGDESMAVMRFATTLVQFPLGLVATTVAFAVLPTLSRYGQAGVAVPTGAPSPGSGADLTPGPSPHAERGEGVRSQYLRGGNALAPIGNAPALPQYKETLAMGLRLALLAILPAAVGLWMVRVPVVQLLFERGRFDADATGLTALAFTYYAPQLPFVAVDQLLIFAFYALKNTFTPMLVGVLGVAIYLVVGVLLIGPMGMPGLVLANTLQNSLHAVVLFLLLWRTVGPIFGGKWVATTGKALLASGVMAAIYYLAAPWLPGREELALASGQALYLGAAIALCFAIYVATLFATGVEETRWLWQGVRARWLRRG